MANIIKRYDISKYPVNTEFKLTTTQVYSTLGVSANLYDNGAVLSIVEDDSIPRIEKEITFYIQADDVPLPPAYNYAFKYVGCYFERTKDGHKIQSLFQVFR